MKFVIDRKTWRRGGLTEENYAKFGPTRLLNKQGYMCCLGQIAQQCGVPDKEILNLQQPKDVFAGYTIYRSLLTIYDNNNTLAIYAVSINDNVSISDTEREQQLIELFASRGHELEFVS